MLRSRSVLIGCIVTAALVVTAVGYGADARTNGSTTASASQPFKVAWIYLGSPADGGWNLGHDLGRQYVQSKLGTRVITTYKEDVPESPQVLSVINQLVAAGNKLIFGTSFGYQKYFVEAAKKYPSVLFEMATGTALARNLSEYNAAQEDGEYLAGIAAGRATQSGHIGFVAPFPIPVIMKTINGFVLGVRSVKPNATVHVVFVGSFSDPVAESKAATSLISSGVDVLGEQMDTPTVCEAAQAANLTCTGNTINQKSYTPKAWLTGNVVNWGPYYLQEVKKAMAGTWKSASNYLTIKSGIVGIAPFGPAVSKSTRALIRKKEAALKRGTFYEFTGPIYDQKGKLRVRAHKRMTLSSVINMNWFVKGVIGSTS